MPPRVCVCVPCLCACVHVCMCMCHIRSNAARGISIHTHTHIHTYIPSYGSYRETNIQAVKTYAVQEETAIECRIGISSGQVLAGMLGRLSLSCLLSISHVSYLSVMFPIYQSCFLSISHVSYLSVMFPIYASCLLYIFSLWVMSRLAAKFLWACYVGIPTRQFCLITCDSYHKCPAHTLLRMTFESL
jgi:hypothetical protein